MKFSSFNLKKEIIEALNKLGYEDATEIQDVVIPKALKGENIVAQSETGSGKTHSFIVPILNKLKFNKNVQAIIISPTRELATQTYKFITEFKDYLPELSCKLFISGIDQKRNVESIQNGCEIVVATPGRFNYLKQFIKTSNANIETIVLDEADMLINRDFIEQIDEIINTYPLAQIEVFSATINSQVKAFLEKYIKSKYFLSSGENKTSHTVNHYLVNIRHRDPYECVETFIKLKRPYLLMIFTNTQVETKKLYDYLSGRKYQCGILSGELESRERKAMLRRINNDEFQIVVCTDIASRGLDILNVTDVLSIDLPNNLEFYYHRAGRSGRNYKEGNSYVFYNLDDTKKVKKIIDSGVKFNYLKFNNDELIVDTSVNKKRYIKKNTSEEYNRDIKKAISDNKSQKVKPGYKKKIKLAVKKVNQQYRREAIKKNIRKELDKKYKGGNYE